MILDTHALSAFLISDRKLLRILSNHAVLRLPVIVLGEYRFGLLTSRDREPMGLLLDELESRLDVLPVDGGTVQPYADIRQQLRVIGKPIPQNDAWIGALARQHQLPIVSRDTHFDAISGIHRVVW